MEKTNKSLEAQLAEMTSKMEDYQRQTTELINEKSKFTLENSELARQLEESENSVMQLNKIKSTLARSPSYGYLNAEINKFCSGNPILVLPIYLRIGCVCQLVLHWTSCQHYNGEKGHTSTNLKNSAQA